MGGTIAEKKEMYEKRLEDPAFRKRYIKTRGDREFITYDGLCQLAHEDIAELRAYPEQLPSEANGWVAVCRALLKTTDGRVFEDVGDATMNNVNSAVRPHMIRVAATRAKVRVLRDMLGIGMVAADELTDADADEADLDADASADEAPTPEPETAKAASARKAPEKTAPPKAAAPKTAKSNGFVCEECGEAIGPAIAAFSRKKFGRELCMKCQQKAANAS